MSILREIIASERPVSVIFVGDVVSRNSAQAGLRATIRVVDQKENRKPTKNPEFSHGKVVRFENMAGTINATAWNVLRKAQKDADSLVIVDGEEDLITLVAIDISPDGSLVVYGQPRKGIVVVRVNGEKRGEISTILKSMSSA